MEMRSEEHEVQQWIFCCVDGDEDCDSVGLVFYSQGREGKKKEPWVVGVEVAPSSIGFSSKKILIHC